MTIKRVDRYDGGRYGYVIICKTLDEKQRNLDALLYLRRSRVIREVAEPYVAV